MSDTSFLGSGGPVGVAVGPLYLGPVGVAVGPLYLGPVGMAVGPLYLDSLYLVRQSEKLTRQTPKLAGKCSVTDILFNQDIFFLFCPNATGYLIPENQDTLS